MPDQYKYQIAIHDFQSARQRAAIREILSRIAGKSNQLLSYDKVAEELKLPALRWEMKRSRRHGNQASKRGLRKLSHLG